MDQVQRGAAPPPSEGVEIEWGVVSNAADGESGFVSELILRNQGRRLLPDEGWALYFNFGRSIDTSSVTPTVRIEHINGDFYRLEPTDEFPETGPGSRSRIMFTSSAWATNVSDAPDGFYFVWGDPESGTVDRVGDPAILPFTDVRQTRRMRADQLPVSTAALRYEENLPLHTVPAADVPPIIPRPLQVEQGSGFATIDAETTIAFEAELRTEAEFLADALAEVLGTRPGLTQGSTGALVLAQEGQGRESYRLTTGPSGIRIEGADPAGVFYGIQSLRALIPIDAYGTTSGSVTLPAVTVEDAPRFGYRGMHLDVARNFQAVEEVKLLLDLMAFHKLNKFHFHLTDDEGWRLPVDALPELTSVGGRRGHTLSEEEHLMPSLGSGPFADPARSRGSGFYTREEFIDILQHAHRRHIEVIPEIDLPGHARAAIVAMEMRARRTGGREHLLYDPLDASDYRSVQMWSGNVVNVCMPSTYAFIETVVDAVVDLFETANVPLNVIHTGGDEVPEGVWEESPACEELIRRSNEVDDVDDLHDYFLRRVDAILDRHGLVTAGWEEIALRESNGQLLPNPAFLDAGFRPYVWNSVWGWGGEANAYKLANAGYDVVIANASTFYFDLAHAKHPEEPGMYWAGYVSMQDPFAFIPFDLYKSAELDLMGRPIPDTAYARSERLTLAGREHILGLQGQLWGENIRSEDRLEFMAFPRMLSLAERAWAERPSWALVEDDAQRRERMIEDWNVFANALGRRELPRLDQTRGGIHYRIPPPGAVIENGVLKANVALPGMTIRYTTDGSVPNTASTRYEGPVRVEGPVRLRTFNTTGRGSRTVNVEPES